jgi:hypothetical protein
MILTDTAKTAYASEAGHWYGRDGSSQYEIVGKTGRRNTTLRDARKLGLVPSVTTIIKCAAAPGLELWKANQLMMAALTLPKRDDESEAKWLERVVHDSKETGRNAADRGSLIHAAIQGHYEGKRIEPGMLAYCHGASESLAETFGADLPWVAEQSFAHPMGFGGKVDIHCGIVVADFKTKEFDDPLKKMAYDEHAMQLAAYRVGLGFPKARCANVFCSVTKPGLAVVHEWPEEDLAKGWRMFCGLLQYWTAKSGYDPSWTPNADQAAA